MPLPDEIELETGGELVLGRDGYFDYEPVLDRAVGIEWHVNFTDPHLFVAYGSSPFAQDEMQVAEHPALGALKEALTADGHRDVTVEHGQPTPVLLIGCRASLPRLHGPDANVKRKQDHLGMWWTWDS